MYYQADIFVSDRKLTYSKDTNLLMAVMIYISEFTKYGTNKLHKPYC